MAHQEQIKQSILSKIRFIKHLHKRHIKSAIDETKAQYILDRKIAINDLLKIINYFKSHWQDLKLQAKSMRKASDLVAFSNFQM